MKSKIILGGLIVASLCTFVLLAQNSPREERNRGDVLVGGPPGFGGPGGMREETKLLKKFDKDKDKMLNSAERKEAREFLVKERAEGRAGSGRFGPRRTEPESAPEPGPKVSPSDV